MLKPLKKAKVTNSVLIAMTVCFFVLSKSKKVSSPSETPTSNPVQVSQQTEQPQSHPEPEFTLPQEVPSLARAFSKQLNRKKSNPKPTFRKAVAKKKKKILPSVLSKLSAVGLEEAPQGSVFSIDPYESETLLDPHFSLQAYLPRENPVTIQEGVLIAQDLSGVWEAVRSYPKTPKLINHRKPIPKKEKAPEESLEPKWVAQSDSVPTPAVESLTPVPLAEAKVTQAPKMTTQEFRALEASPTDVTELIDRGKHLLKKWSPLREDPPAPRQSKVSSQWNPSNRNNIPGVEPTRVSTEPVGKIFGKLTLDTATQDWINSLKGHVELRLQRANSSDPQDVFFVDYRYPERDFSWDGRGVTGEYRLIASFFEPSKPVAFAQVLYPSRLSAENAKQMVIFHIQKGQVTEAMSSASAHTRDGITLSGTVFEANTGEHTQSKTVPNAEVSVVGFPQWGVFKADKDGTFRIPQVASQSEYILSIKAPGYYSTEVVAPVFQTTSYVSIHLISKNHVDTITRFFTKRAQDEKKAIIFGRVFNPQTRSPQPDQEVSLVGRKAQPLYFGILPDQSLKQTTSSGVFAYFNVDPAFRAVGKAERSAHELLQARPGSAYHVEFGRSGETDLRGRLFDPYRQQAVLGRVKLVGSPLSVDTNELGDFVLPAMDLAPGILTLEVESPGYPNSWHTISWSAREGLEKYTLYLPEEELLTEVRSSVAKVTEIPGRGSLLGGAQPQFFRDLKKCVYVSLENSLGQPNLNSEGPFPLHRGDSNPNKRLCLTKDRPGFSFFNLEPGQYILNWKTPDGSLLRTHVVRVGANRTTILIN